jgi:hypothetical protein
MRYIDFTIDPKMLKILMMLYHLKIRKWKLWNRNSYCRCFVLFRKRSYLMTKRIKATSVYLVDRVVPMLPEVCLILLVHCVQMKKIYFFGYFEITDKCGRSMVWKNGIYSDQRFAYEEAQYIIETKDNTRRNFHNRKFLCCFMKLLL